MKVLIVGLGLMGGSMALTLREKGFEVLGCDLEHNAKKALELGIVDTVYNGEDVDVIILATPINAIINWLQAPPKLTNETTVIDLGSTKKEIIAAAFNMRKNFVAAHPMCGTEYSGPMAAFNTLYDKKTVVLCDLQNSGEKQIADAYKIFNALNMKIETMDAALHDKHAAFISHLPHILSFALANTVLSQESPSDILTMAAGGFRDMSRLAKSSPELWAQIFASNKDDVLKTIDIFETELSALKQAVRNNDKDELIDKMKLANGLHQLFTKDTQ